MVGETVLVTGGTGFIGGHCIVQLLAAGYPVRTTVRSLSYEPRVRAVVAAGLRSVADGDQSRGNDGTGVGSSAADGAGSRAANGARSSAGETTSSSAADDRTLSVVEADLSVTDGWAAAADGCTYVLHVASPYPQVQPENANELVAPARDGTIRVLRAARDAGVRRVVLTSSFAAVGFRAHEADHVYTEADWSDPATALSPYASSKYLAERAAWRFMAGQPGDLELAVVNPVSVFGPALGPHLSTSLELVRGYLNGVVPAVPRVFLSAVDVRDVADLHLRAMTHPDARGERFLAVTGSPLTLLQVAQLLRSRLIDDAQNVPKRQLPDWTVSLMAPFTPHLEEARLQLGITRPASSAKAKKLLGWQPRTNVEAIVAAAESLVALGLVAKS